MKGFFRSKPVTYVLGALIWLWMALIAWTIRWRVEGVETARTSWSDTHGAVVAAWHSRILLLPSGWIRHMRHWPGPITDGAMLISLSPDGEAVAQAISHLGLKSVRGSGANKKKAKKDKGGARAIAEAVRLLRSGTAVCITPDGPRGPAEQVSPGAILIAQRAEVPILPYALAARPVIRLNSWDRFIIAFPFTRGAIVFGDPVPTSRDMSPETLRNLVQQSLDAATRRANALVGLPALPNGEPAKP